MKFDEIEQIEKSRRKLKKEIYLKIYDQFNKKIKTYVELGHKHTILTVPTFLLGYPKYDVIKACNYLQRQFELGKFTVHRMTPVEIYVSWAKAGKGPSSPSLPIDDSPENDFTSLINLKKMASKYKKTNN
jgi:hypothetical protein